jgi:hypothetical protein
MLLIFCPPKFSSHSALLGHVVQITTMCLCLGWSTHGLWWLFLTLFSHVIHQTAWSRPSNFFNQIPRQLFLNCSRTSVSQLKQWGAPLPRPPSHVMACSFVKIQVNKVGSVLFPWIFRGIVSWWLVMFYFCVSLDIHVFVLSKSYISFIDAPLKTLFIWAFEVILFYINRTLMSMHIKARPTKPTLFQKKILGNRGIILAGKQSNGECDNHSSFYCHSIYQPGQR